MDNIRTLMAGIVSGIMGYLHPLQGDVFTLLLIFVLNFAFGLLSGILSDGEKFSLKKAWRCMNEAAIFFLLVASIFAVGHFKEEEAGALQCVSTVVYVVLYFYATNILRNIRKMLREGSPAYMAVSLLYYIMSMEVVKRIPHLGDFLNVKDGTAAEEDRIG